MIPDILVVGAGVFGLSVALAAHRAGMSVEVIEADRPGAGASGGFVGALTPHAPTKWRPMMAFQFAALQALERRASALQDQTGIDPGYGRVGRIMPLTGERALERASADLAAAPALWGPDQMQILPGDGPGLAANFAPGLATHGVAHDRISARISPRAYLAAMVAALPDGTVRHGQVTAARAGPMADISGGPRAAGHIVLAGGARGWPLLPPKQRGSGIKGQAALLQLHVPDLPVITHDGMYIVPHGDGTVAVGSTSEKQWEDSGPDAALDALLARAVAAVPMLAGAPVIERWAGIRPKPPGREPIVGPVPGQPGVWAAGGGFRIGFGIAHAVGDAVIAMISGQRPTITVPDSFLPAANMPG